MTSKNAIVKFITVWFVLISGWNLNSQTIVKKDSLKETLITTSVNIPDKLNVLLPDSYYKKSDPIKDYLPALLTLLAGFITVLVNWRISKSLREATKENIERQLAESRTIKITEIKASVNLKNRQEWMHQFREVISEFIALVALNTALEADKDTLREDARTLVALNVKIGLLLHPNREFENEALIQVSILFQLLTKDISKREENHVKQIADANTALIEQSRLILEKNWQKMNTVE